MGASKIQKMVNKNIKTGYYRTKFALQDTLKGKNPIRRFQAYQRAAKKKMQKATRRQIQSSAVQNVRELQNRANVHKNAVQAVRELQARVPMRGTPPALPPRPMQRRATAPVLPSRPVTSTPLVSRQRLSVPDLKPPTRAPPPPPVKRR